tara:strand:+ start:661 stop:1797 length:1137 start_codon:yes stop_codon:yes gene_type:complete
MLLGISEMEKVIKKDPSKRKELNDMKKALRNYKIECGICKGRANSDQDCLNQALKNLSRQMPFIKDSVYPWLNYDWDYGNYIDNNFSAKATGSSSRGDAYIRNAFIFMKLFSAYVFRANPNNKGFGKSKSIPGGTNKYSDYPIYGCQGKNSKNCKVWNYIKNRNKQKAPYKSDFFNKQLDGERSSSYFVRVGNCPRPDIKYSRKCINNGFVWKMNPDNKTGICFQPRYAYINNQPGMVIRTPGEMLASAAFSTATGESLPGIKYKGYIPSFANDVLSLSPEKLMRAYSGLGVAGHMDVQDCPAVSEQFVPRGRTSITRPKLLFKHNGRTDINGQKSWFKKVAFTDIATQNNILKQTLSASIIIVLCIIFIVMRFAKYL